MASSLLIRPIAQPREEKAWQRRTARVLDPDGSLGAHPDPQALAGRARPGDAGRIEAVDEDFDRPASGLVRRDQATREGYLGPGTGAAGSAGYRLHPAGPRGLPAHDRGGEPRHRRDDQRPGRAQAARPSLRLLPDPGRAPPSGGRHHERRPAAAARDRRALVGNPDLLLLDEPSEGTQPSIVEEIFAIMLKINRELGTTILFVEQNLDMIMAMTPALLRHGQGPHHRRAVTAHAGRRDTVKRHLQI